MIFLGCILTLSFHHRRSSIGKLHIA